MPKLVAVTVLDSGKTRYLASGDIVKAVLSGTADSLVKYRNKAKRVQNDNEEIIVDETLAALASAAPDLIAIDYQGVTDNILLNPKRMARVQASGSGSIIHYDEGGSEPLEIPVDENPAAVLALAGNMVAIDFNGVTDGITLSAERIKESVDEGSGARLYYDQASSELTEILVDEDSATIQGYIDLL